MNVTPKLGLRKPESSDQYNIADFNYNMDILDDAGGGGGGGSYSYSLIASGSGARTASYTSTVSGSYKLLVIAMNSEAETKDLVISASKNGTALTGSTLRYNEYSYSQSSDDKRNYRVNVYNVTLAAGDVISLSVSSATEYTSLIYAIIDGNFDTLTKAVTACDDTASGTYSGKAIVVYGTSDDDSGTYHGTIYTAGEPVTTAYSGISYTSAYIFWLIDSTQTGGPAINELLAAPIVGGTTQTITLNDYITKYDALEFRVGVYASDTRQYFTTSVLVSDLYESEDAVFVGGTIVSSSEYSAWYMIAYDDTNHLTIVESGQSGWSESRTIFGIKGIKWG